MEFLKNELGNDCANLIIIELTKLYKKDVLIELIDRFIPKNLSKRYKKKYIYITHEYLGGFWNILKHQTDILEYVKSDIKPFTPSNEKKAYKRFFSKHCVLKPRGWKNILIKNLEEKHHKRLKKDTLFELKTDYFHGDEMGVQILRRIIHEKKRIKRN